MAGEAVQILDRCITGEEEEMGQKMKPDIRLGVLSYPG